jgi:hypothetical protein
MPPTTPEPTHTTVHDQSKLKPSSFNPKKSVILLVIIGIILIALVAFISLAIIASDSTPDQKLYNFKTNYVEKVIRATKLSESSKLEYTNTLLEKRVAELLTLYSDNSTSTPETLDRLASLTQQHTGDSVWMIQNSDALTSQEKMTRLALITNTTRAFESLANDTEEFDSISDYSGDIQNISQDGLKAEVEEFASTTDPGLVSAFTGEQITALGEEIKTVAPNSRAQRLALSRIDEAGESITDAKFSDAIYALFRGRQAIAVDRYLYASERGEGNTDAPDLENIPEGS